MNDVDDKILKCEDLFERYRNIPYKDYNSANSIELYHNWYDLAAELFYSFVAEDDLQLNRFMCVDNSGNGYCLHDNFSKIRSSYKILIEKFRTMRNEEINTCSNRNNKNIFIVHGRNNERKESIARFISQLGLKPIILQEQTNQGDTIIEKIERQDAEYAVILYTPCDCGYLNDDTKPNIELRARQNVVFEHGLLCGRLGRKNTCAIVDNKITLPSDINGIGYIAYDEAGAWKTSFAKELQKAGYEIDLNNLL